MAVDSTDSTAFQADRQIDLIDLLDLFGLLLPPGAPLPVIETMDKLQSAEHSGFRREAHDIT
jgi:hypothetical protein